jgi:hypothetical protein
MASTDRPIEIDYDPRADVLYASLGASQPALSYEVAEDVLLRYVPLEREVSWHHYYEFFAPLFA